MKHLCIIILMIFSPLCVAETTPSTQTPDRIMSHTTLVKTLTTEWKAFSEMAKKAVTWVYLASLSLAETIKSYFNSNPNAGNSEVIKAVDTIEQQQQSRMSKPAQAAQ
jgi:hypothetical protein